jgi:hypothetical protein
VCSKSFFVPRSIGTLENLRSYCVVVSKTVTANLNLKYLPVMFPAAHAMKVIVRAVDFLVWPAMFREMREKIKFP